MPAPETWSDRLRGWALGSTSAATRAASELLVVAARLETQAAQFESHAELAPNEQADRELRRLAAAGLNAAERLRGILVERGLAPSEAGAPALTTAASHWARLVQDLDEVRALRGVLIALTTDFEDRDAGLDAVIGELIRVTEVQLAGLRGMIARADPQALD